MTWAPCFVLRWECGQFLLMVAVFRIKCHALSGVCGTLSRGVMTICSWIPALLSSRKSDNGSGLEPPALDREYASHGATWGRYFVILDVALVVVNVIVIVSIVSAASSLPCSGGSETALTDNVEVDIRLGYLQNALIAEVLNVYFRVRCAIIRILTSTN